MSTTYEPLNLELEAKSPQKCNQNRFQLEPFSKVKIHMNHARKVTIRSTVLDTHLQETLRLHITITESCNHILKRTNRPTQDLKWWGRSLREAKEWVQLVKAYIKLKKNAKINVKL